MRTTLILCAAIVGIAIGIPVYAQAQGNAMTATLCIGVYLDANGNGSRDADERGLSDINLSLSIAPGVIVTNFVTENSAPYCFEALPAEVQYTLTIYSPDYVVASPDPITFTPQRAEQIAREFPLVIRIPDELPSGILSVPLNTRTRLALSSICAVGAMGFLAGIGSLFYGIFFYPRKRKAVKSDNGDSTAGFRQRQR